MREEIVAPLIFLCLAAASLGTLALQHRLPSHHREDDTQNVVRLIANFFVVMTSLVMGLLVNSAKNTLESVDRNVHTYAANLIVLDRTLQHYGPDAVGARQSLLAYAQRAAHSALRDDPLLADRTAEGLLDEVSKSLKALKPQDADQAAQLQSARQQLQRIVELRWVIVGQAEGTIPGPLVVMLAVWLVLIFASYGYRAPHNGLVVTTFLAASLLFAGAFWLILDMDRPFSGPVQVKLAPLLRAVAEMQR
jgi:Protein of unknown function (DUF4239)